jgi:hypothetical protein
MVKGYRRLLAANSETEKETKGQAVVPVNRGMSRWKNLSGSTPTATFALGLNGSSGAEGPGMLVSMGGDLRTGAWPS